MVVIIHMMPLFNLIQFLITGLCWSVDGNYWYYLLIVFTVDFFQASPDILFKLVLQEKIQMSCHWLLPFAGKLFSKNFIEQSSQVNTAF